MILQSTRFTEVTPMIKPLQTPIRRMTRGRKKKSDDRQNEAVLLKAGEMHWKIVLRLRRWQQQGLELVWWQCGRN